VCYAECRYAECRFAECRGAVLSDVFQNTFLINETNLFVEMDLIGIKKLRCLFYGALYNKCKCKKISCSIDEIIDLKEYT
jgi:hypothetical protein